MNHEVIYAVLNFGIVDVAAFQRLDRLAEYSDVCCIRSFFIPLTLSSLQVRQGCPPEHSYVALKALRNIAPTPLQEIPQIL